MEKANSCEVISALGFSLQSSERGELNELCPRAKHDYLKSTTIPLLELKVSFATLTPNLTTFLSLSPSVLSSASSIAVSKK